MSREKSEKSERGSQQLQRLPLQLKKKKGERQENKGNMVYN